MIRIPSTFTIFFWLLAGTGIVCAQPGTSDRGRGCYSKTPPAGWDNWFNELTQQYRQQQITAKEQANVYKLPVVVHVIHGGEPVGKYPNISAAQIESQIKVLNEDFSGIGFGVSGVPDPFKNEIANCDIIFSPAQLDPNGKPLVEPGIHRVNWQDLGPNANPENPISNSGFQSDFDKYIKPVTIWDPERYFNIWVSTVRNSLDILGYATFPVGSGLSGIIGGGTPSTDGVWIVASSFGTVGTVPPYHMGRTATHEIGHWLGLRHIWGDANCGNDFCDDTPKQNWYNLGCAMEFPKFSCGNQPDGEMFMNFMDYGDDPCITMFTWDQRTRMHAAMQNADFRKQLTASSATLCDLEPEVPVASFTVPSTACTNTFITISNQSSGIPGPNCSWHIEPAEGVRLAVDQQSGDLILVAEIPGNYSLTLTATNSKGQSSAVQAIGLTDCGIMPGIGELSGSGAISVFPNPADGIFSLEAPGEASMAVAVIDAMGGLVATGSGCGKVIVDITDKPNGIYFAVISTSGIRQVKKLMLCR